MMALSNLAGCYMFIERCTESVELSTTCLERRRVVLGPKHPDTILSMVSLGAALNHLSRHEESIEVGQEAAELMREVFGPDDPRLYYFQGMADSMRALGRYEEARALIEDVLKGLAAVSWRKFVTWLRDNGPGLGPASAMGAPSR